jgi:zinc protease
MGMVVKPSTDLVVAAGILGNGFSGRLMKYVRDKKGLTYGIGSKVKRENGTGILKIVATFAPTCLEEGMEATTHVLDQWFDSNTITQKEVDIQKQILLGSRTVHFDQPEAIAGTVHNAAVTGMGVKYIDDFTKKVNAVTLRSVQAAINGLDRNNLKTVIAGTFS